MRYTVIGMLSLAVSACGPSAEPQGVKTPDQILAEQEQLGEQELREKEKADSSSAPPEVTEDEKARQWDEHQAELELKRASHSAETCPDSVTEKSPKGRALVTITFGNDGHVKSSSLGAPYEKTKVGECVLRAIDAVIVPAYKGEEHTVKWEVDLTGKKNSGFANGGG